MTGGEELLVEASAAGRASVIPEALLFGILLGLIYDVFRVLRTALGLRAVSGGGQSGFTLRLRAVQRRRLIKEHRERSKKTRGHGAGAVVLFFLDILYALLCGIGTAVFLYWRNDGMVRWYLLLSVLCGFYAYYRTCGVLVMHAASALTALLRAADIWIYNHSAYYVFALLLRLFRVFCAGVSRFRALAAARRRYILHRRAAKRSEKLCAEASAALCGAAERLLH